MGVRAPATPRSHPGVTRFASIARASASLRDGGFDRAVVATFSMRLGARVLALPTAILLARLLGPAGYGEYAYALAWATLLGSFAVVGLDRFLVRAIARAQTTGDLPASRGVLRWADEVAAIASAALVLLFAAVAPLFVKDQFLHLTWIALVLVPLFALTVVRQGALLGFGRVELSFVPEQLIVPGLLLLLVAGAAATGVIDVTPEAAVAANVVVATVAFVAGFVLLRRSLPAETRVAVPRYERRAWTASLVPFALIGFIGIADSQVSTLALGSLADARAVGIYQVASRIAQVASLALAAINAPFTPLAARLHAAGQMEELARLSRRVARVGLASCVPLVVAMIVVRDQVLGIFGSDYRAGATTLTLLALAQLANVVFGPVGVVLMMAASERVAAFGFGAGLVANAGVTIVLAPHLGATGAAVGQCVGMTLWNVLLWMYARRRLGIDTAVFGRGPAR